MKKQAEKCVINVSRDRVRVKRRNDPCLMEIGTRGAKHAAVNDDCDLILITTEQGRIELWSGSGLFLRTIGCGNARRAKFNGNDIIVLTEDSTVELRSLEDEFLLSIS